MPGLRSAILPALAAVLLVPAVSASETELKRLSLGPEVLDGYCEGIEDGRRQLFVYDSRGHLAQWLLPADGTAPQPVRTLPGVVEPAACYVDSEAGDLYVLEENIGLWRYGAAAGSNYDRELLLRYQPNGPLDPEVEHFSSGDGEVRIGTVAVPLRGATPAARQPLPSVLATAETDPVYHSGDAADDPAIWHNPRQGAASLILGADKRYGLRVYSLEGKEIQRIAAGRLNNIDLRPLPEDAPFAALAAASNRSLGAISLFAISAEGEVSWLQGQDIETGLDDPYGLCMYAEDGQLHVFVNDKDGRLQQWQLTRDGSDFEGTRVRELTLPDQPEGCAADDQHQRLFLGQENQGLYTLDLASTDSAPQLLAAIDDNRLFADVEGMDIYHQGDAGYLVVSSQGNASFAVFERLPPHRYRGSVRIASNDAMGIDGVSDTDGLAVHSGNFGPGFEHGLLVTQDGYNTLPREPQNFKIIAWDAIAQRLELD